MLGNLDSLPGGKDDYAPVTIDGNGQVIVRARGAAQSNTTEGRARALQRPGAGGGFRYGPPLSGARAAARIPAHQHCERRPAGRVPRREATIRLAGARQGPHAEVEQACDPTVLDRRNGGRSGGASADTGVGSRSGFGVSPPIPHDVENSSRQGQFACVAGAGGRGPIHGTDRVGIATVLGEAEAIKDLLHQAFSRTHQLVVNMKRYRRQAQAVRAALGSLRHLQDVAD